MKSSEVRQIFLDFFKSKNHQIVPSAPIVVKDDPTLMFTNAGMNQFKDIFLGVRQPEFPRVANSQKCLRVSGKHNDLEEVGVDTYHHTMFEMLGNWSFGDYFKNEAITWAWELITEHYSLDKSRIYVTVFEGDHESGIEFDEESFRIWKQFLPENHILKGSKKDNFWEMGDTGPCGPCTEIHYDLRSDEERKKIPGNTLVNTSHPHVIEIWNLVFIQYNRKQDGTLETLPAKHVDTGMGFERLCMVLQGKQSTYDTDVFKPVITALENITGYQYQSGNNQKDIAFRVVADHLRAISFCIADGQLPSNTGPGYVVRRILRRAVRYGFSFLNQKDPFIFSLVPILSHQMGAQFPELVEREKYIMDVIREEEITFLRTLERGLSRFEEFVNANPGLKVIPGDVAFEMYDTYGFPIDLTQLLAREKNLSVDTGTFQNLLNQQKERSRNATKLETGDWVILKEGLQTEFVGYDMLETKASILRYRKITEGKKEAYQVVLDRTPFYPEGGGQTGDSGWLIDNNGKQWPVIDTKKENQLIVLKMPQLPENTEGIFLAKVNEDNRRLAAAHHSATHLLHYALRTLLGNHVEQKGSYVGPDKLRFDFSHYKKMEEEEIRSVEKMVNDLIFKAIPLNEIRETSLEEAKKMNALMFFGEKYGEKVRVINFGPSTELCGGTHVPNTAYIRLFKIVSETAVAAGVRRIEAVASNKAIEFYENILSDYQKIVELIKNDKQPVKTLENILQQFKQQENIIESFVNREKEIFKKQWIEKRKEIDGMYVLATVEDIPDERIVRNALFELIKQHPDSVFLVGFKDKGKAKLHLAVGDEVLKKKSLNAAEIIRNLAGKINGGGGGQPFYATAGGGNPAGLTDCVAAFEEILRNHV